MDMKRQEEALRSKLQSLAESREALAPNTYGASLKESTEALSSYDNHPADLGTMTFEREKDLGLLGTVRDIEVKVKAALRRIDEGTYGKCVRCEGPIAEERLAAQPWSDLCIDCQRIEEIPDPHPRPLEEDVLAPPFGRSFKDNSPEGVVEFDGEDAWQAVARMGTSNSPSDVPPAVNYGETYVGFESEDIGYVEDTDISVEGTDPGDLPEAPGIAPPEGDGR